MKPETKSETLLAIARSKAKMFEYAVPEEEHIAIPQDPAALFVLAVGILGDEAADECRRAGAALDGAPAGSTRFSAHFFDAYLGTRLNRSLDPEVVLLGAASYYLCDLPGSSAVLAQRLGEGWPDMGALSLDLLLHRSLLPLADQTVTALSGPFAEYVTELPTLLRAFLEQGTGREILVERVQSLRSQVYRTGTPRELLFADLSSALVFRRLSNSTWESLPSYSGLPVEQWQASLRKRTFLRELWPAQHLIGEARLFQGRSAVVQMPTSAGKSRAIELVIRSAFLGGRATLAVVVAPFRSLCHEIRATMQRAFAGESVAIDEFTDVLQTDIGPELVGEELRVLIATPEKLLYVLRHRPELAEAIGLLVFDEGHQFDSGTRGVTYELLLTSLKALVPGNIQKVLISAVISNAAAVNEWLNGPQSEVVYGGSLSPTQRTLAFASWQDRLGRLQFVRPEDPDAEEFFVPRVIERHELQLREGERTERVFPLRDDGATIALYLGLKLVANGAVAVFCGRKNQATSLASKLVEAYSRGLEIPSPLEESDAVEVRRLARLYEENLGDESSAAQAAALGVFTHHGNSPQGVRLALEHAMKEGLARYVICTSTLAQGVNLPIRYLLVVGVYQGKERIKVRDFQNLIGRAGRSGMHTEGSIIFSDPKVYDQRRSERESWRWRQTKTLLRPDLSEPCLSTILSVLQSIRSDDGRRPLAESGPLDLARQYVEDPEGLSTLPAEIEARWPGFSAQEVSRQLARKVHILASIENYLLAHWGASEAELDEDAAASLARGTLAHHLAEESERAQLVELFRLLAGNIRNRVPESSVRRVFGRTLYGVKDNLAIAAWLEDHVEGLRASVGQAELFDALWPLFWQLIEHKDVKRCSLPEALQDMAHQWLEGEPFYRMSEYLNSVDAAVETLHRRFAYKLEQVVDICQNSLAFEATLVLSAATEWIGALDGDNIELVRRLERLQKSLRYGVPWGSPVVLYELGFSDRVIAQLLGGLVGQLVAERQEVVARLRARSEDATAELSSYPSYFSRRLATLI